MKQVLLIIGTLMVFNSYADQLNESTEIIKNNPTVNSKLYSGAQFPEQNEITNNKAKYNSTKNLNNPTVNSKLYSGAQFPEQNNF